MIDELAADVGRALGSRVVATAHVAGGSINQAYRLSLDDGRDVFVKVHPSGLPAMFRREADGLRWLAEASAVRVPEVLAVADDDASNGGLRWLALEWIERGSPSPAHDEELGRALARLHAFGAPTLGWSEDNFVGDLPQRNGPTATWAEFYVAQRLQPLVRDAHGQGRLPADATARFDRLFARMPELVGDEEPPSRLHGDLWAGNAIVGADGGPWLIDPAVYGGHREVDLAMMRLFGGFSERVFLAYDEELPLQIGYELRVALYQLYPLLVHVVLFGGGYTSSVLHALSRYVD